MTALRSVAVATPDPAATEAFHTKAFDLGPEQGVRAVASTEEPGTGFRGVTLSIVVAQPSTVDDLARTALEAGATEVKPVSRSFWGYGGTVRAPDGTIWTLASSSKKDKGPATRAIESLVVQIAVDDVKASKRFYEEHGLVVEKSYGSRYVQFDGGGAPVTLALLGRTMLAKNAGVDPAGSGPHGVLLGGDAAFTDPDGFVWEAR